MLEVDGRPGAAYEELRVFATDVVRLWPALRASTTESDLAMIYSYDNEFYQGLWQGPKTYESRVYRFYVGLKSLQRNVDLVSPDVDLFALSDGGSSGTRDGDRCTSSTNGRVCEARRHPRAGCEGRHAG